MRLIKIFILIVFSSVILYSQQNFPYQINYKIFPSSPGSLRFGLNGFDNPALLTYIKNPEIYFIWNNANRGYFNLNDYGIFAGFKNFGFAFYSDNFDAGRISNYGFSSSLGNRKLSFGFSYLISKSSIQNFEPDNLITLSALYRPNKYISLGLIETSNSKFNSFESTADLAVRPFGNNIFTLFGDFSHLKLENRNSENWSAGLIIEPLEGLQITSRYFKTKSFSIGIQLSFGETGIFQTAAFNQKGKSIEQIQGLRIGSFDKTFIQKLIKKEKSHKLDLNGQIKYQKFQLFDNSKTLYELIDKLEKIKNDKTIKQVEINTSGLTAPKVFLWELREKIIDLRKNGKQVVIYVDNADMSLYHFASAADKIIMDPLGLITLEGVLLGRNYYKGTLEKIGLGFDELRFFKYKSAAETFSREKMSDEDREQRQVIVDNIYNTIKSEVETSRINLKIPFDSLVNNFVVFDAKKALEFGLVDSLGRWYELKDEKKSKDNTQFVRDNKIESESANDFSWGEKPKVAVIYVLGACAMDEGIKARTLIKDIERVSKDKSIKAVVFRIDSPGGDALASDVIAKAMLKLKQQKPVIVSQGTVAASGGYWLSMYADTIVSNKNTITGSIGVIGSWIYNKGLKESVGVSTDYVKKGDHADLGFGMIIPILNTVIPDRKLTNEERNHLENLIREMYAGFVQRVSEGRNKSSDQIEKAAQGRIWSGIDAVHLGLVDVLGGLGDAIEIARTKAKLGKDEFQIAEYPKQGLFDLSAVLPLPINAKIEKTPIFELLSLQLKYNGKPLTLMPVEDIPEDYFIFNFHR